MKQTKQSQISDFFKSDGEEEDLIFNPDAFIERNDSDDEGAKFSGRYFTTGLFRIGEGLHDEFSLIDIDDEDFSKFQAEALAGSELSIEEPEIFDSKKTREMTFDLAVSLIAC